MAKQIEFRIFYNGHWCPAMTDTDKNFCYPRPKGHKTCFKPLFMAFEASDETQWEGETRCDHEGCSHVFPYLLRRVHD